MAKNTVHKCAKCGNEFPGSGKRGRPHKLCPECREAAASAVVPGPAVPVGTEPVATPAVQS